jgi:hypothetical protein
MRCVSIDSKIGKYRADLLDSFGVFQTIFHLSQVVPGTLQSIKNNFEQALFAGKPPLQMLLYEQQED